jgi:hypothetical protein
MLVVAVELHLFMVVLMELAVLAEAVTVFKEQMELLELLTLVVVVADLLIQVPHTLVVVVAQVSSSLLTPRHK